MNDLRHTVSPSLEGSFPFVDYLYFTMGPVTSGQIISKASGGRTKGPSRLGAPKPVTPVTSLKQRGVIWVTV